MKAERGTMRVSLVLALLGGAGPWIAPVTAQTEGDPLKTPVSPASSASSPSSDDLGAEDDPFGEEDAFGDDPFGDDPFGEESDPFGTTLEEQVLFSKDVVVTSVSKRAQRVRDAPASVYVIPSEDLRRYGYRTVFEALQQVPGVFISDDSEFRTIGMRGPAIVGDFNSRVLVLLDGHPLNELARNTAAGSDLAVPIDLIDRIEVIKGPGSVVYGTSAFFGVVNIVTKGASQLRGGQLAMTYGTEDSYGANLAYGTFLTPELEVVVSGSYMKSDGAREKVRFYNSDASEAEEKSRDAYTRIKWGDFGLSARTSKHTRSQAGSPFATNFDSTGNVYVDEKSWVELSWAPKIGEVGQLSLRAYGDRYRFDDFLDYQPAFRFRDMSESRTFGGEAVVSLETSDTNTFSAGIEFQKTRAEYRSWAPGFGTTAVDQTRFYVLKLFIEDDFVLSDAWRVVAGAQYNYHELFDSGLSPRVAVIWTPTEYDTVKAIYSQGFRNPSYYEAFFDDGSAILQNVGLQSEQVRSGELIYERTFDDEKQASASLWYSKVDDLIQQVPLFQGGLSRLQFQNIEGFEVFGIDLSGQATFDDGIRAFGNVTFQDERGAKLTNYPHWIANGGVSVPILEDRMVLSGTVHAVAERDGGTASADSDPYALVNLTLLIREFPIDHAETTLGVFNLFDDQVWAPTPLYFLPDLMRSQRRALGMKVLIRF